jgi:CO dehydrogenase maturation factor
MITLAISGKGGTGKSTISALIIRWLAGTKGGPILAVDADSNVNLNDLLGLPLKETIGAIREEMRAKISNLPGGMTKPQFLEYKIQSSLVETKDFDLIAMGRPEGQGCYCYANNLLQDVLHALASSYQYVVIDNEAGMEHLSRRTRHSIDYLLMVSDPSPRGIATAGRISRLLAELETRVAKRYLILNRAPQPLPPSLQKAIEAERLELLATIPEDHELLKMDREGIPIWSISPGSQAVEAVSQMMMKLDLERGRS